MAACEACRAIDLFKILANDTLSKSPGYRSQPRIGWVHQTSFSKLRASAATCPSCALFLPDPSPDGRDPGGGASDDDVVKLRARTGSDGWPLKYRNRSTGPDAVFLMRLVVDAGPEGGNTVSYHKGFNVWTTDGKALDSLRTYSPLSDDKQSICKR